jgi:hypothetical protein
MVGLAEVLDLVVNSNRQAGRNIVFEYEGILAKGHVAADNGLCIEVIE